MLCLPKLWVDSCYQLHKARGEGLPKTPKPVQAGPVRYRKEPRPLFTSSLAASPGAELGVTPPTKPVS